VGIWGIGRRGPLSLLSVAGILALTGCNAITGLSDLTIATADGGAGAGGGGTGGGSGTGGGNGTGGDTPDAAPPECTTNRECTAKASLDPAANGAVVESICLKPQGKCAALKTAECQLITGDYNNNDAIVIGSLFATSPTGVNGATNSTATFSASKAPSWPSTRST